ncbi:MAG: hypothetical protein COU51_02295 [Parcubacteria group bacterium CG10_big_fil_rev_8_21_14_0_10_36_14]|nr:MAG: hypothetical protein COU51_02295 [Parcubacteria group bacterium CG10_big_fil_rev_8_21_14_0_10_36_14]
MEKIVAELFLHKNRGLFIALKFGTPGVPYAPRQKNMRVRHSGKRAMRIVDTSIPAPKVDAKEVARALGARLIGNLTLIEHLSIMGELLILVFESKTKLELKEDGCLSFIAEDNRQLVFKADEVKKIYTLDNKGSSQVLWQK